MTSQAGLNAILGLVLMLAVGAAYLVLARRFRLLWHPLSIVVFVGTVGVIVAVLGVLLWGDGWEGVPAMARRSAIGGFGWGVIIAAVVWAGRRVLSLRNKTGRSGV